MTQSNIKDEITNYLGKWGITPIEGSLIEYADSDVLLVQVSGALYKFIENDIVTTGQVNYSGEIYNRTYYNKAQYVTRHYATVRVEVMSAEHFTTARVTFYRALHGNRRLPKFTLVDVGRQVMAETPAHVRTLERGVYYGTLVDITGTLCKVDLGNGVQIVADASFVSFINNIKG